MIYHFREAHLAEWYANGPLGIEQGFTFYDPPPALGDGLLTLSLGRLRGDLTARIVRDGRGLTLSVRGHSVLRYDGLFANDASGRTLPAQVQLVGGRLLLRVDARGARYPVQVDPFVRAAAPTVSPYGVGASVAISGNGEIAAVGAPGSRVNSNVGQGAVYVFKRGRAGWSSAHEVARLTASDGAASDSLGSGNENTFDNLPGPDGVAISRDGKTIVAGAPQAKVGAQTAQGAAYVFREPADGWVSEHETAKLTASGGAANDQLGAVAVSAHGSTVAVGAYGTVDPSYYTASGGGSVYVFTEPSDGWRSESQVAELTPPGIAGSAPAVSMSDNGGTIVVGASDAVVNGNRGEHSNAGQGAAYVFSRPATGWRNERATARLLAAHGNPGDGFGAAVAAAGDGRTVAVGSPSGGGNAASGQPGLTLVYGAVFVFTRGSGKWRSEHPTAQLRVRGDGGDDALGSSVAISDHGSTIAAGAWTLNASHGAAFVFTRPRSGKWRGVPRAIRLTPSPGASDAPASSERFGSSVAVSGGGGTIVAGAFGVNREQGAAYVFKRRTKGWAPEHEAAALAASHSAANDDFGVSVAVSGDGRILVAGAPAAWIGAHRYQGAVFVFTRTAGGWTNSGPVAKLTAAHSAGGDGLGESVAISADGRTIAAGAPTAPVGKTGSRPGAVYIFQEPAAGWVGEHETARLAARHGATGDALGTSIAISRRGGVIAAAAPFAKNGTASFHGAVYLFRKSAKGWASVTRAAKLTASANGYFVGSKVAISGDGSTVAAGALQEHGEGEVFVFTRPASGWTSEHERAVLPTSWGGSGAVALSADGTTLAAGRFGEIRVFARAKSGWTNEKPAARLTTSKGSPGEVGHSLAMSPDGSTIVSGAPANTAGQPVGERGAVYLFRKPTAGWAGGLHEATKLTASDGDQGDCFGCSVAISADGATLAAGAPSAKVGAYGVGAAYMFSQPPGGWSDETAAAKLAG